MKKINLKKGFLMVEVVVATAVILFSVLIAVSVAGKSISLARQTLHTTEASFLLEEGAEAIRILRDNDWQNIANLVPSTLYFLNFSGGTWTLSTSPSQVDIFTRTITVSSVNRDAITDDISVSGNDDPGTKLININVSWQESGQSLSKNLSFYISNIFL